MTSDKPRRKRRRPQTTPGPLTVVSGMPEHIALDRGEDYIIIRCNLCGGSSRHGLPMLSSQVQQAVDEFAGRHQHAPPVVDPDMLAHAAEWLYEIADGRRPSEAARNRIRQLAERLQATSELLRGSGSDE